MGPDKDIEDLNEAIRYIKDLATSLDRKIPYTSQRLRQCMLQMRKAQQRLQAAKKNK